MNADTTPAEPFSFGPWLRKKWNASRRPSVAFKTQPDPKHLGGVPNLHVSQSTTNNAASTVEEQTCSPVSEPLYFRFELQENQRWWMGLDWTSALLPQERPSWCDIYLNPSSPPNAFVLPSDSVMYLPEPKVGDPGGRTRRTSRWHWVDEDWSVVKKSGQIDTAQNPSRGSMDQARPPASPSQNQFGAPTEQAPQHHSSSPDEPKKGVAEQAFVKGLERLKARTLGHNHSNSSPTSPSSKRPLSGEFSSSAEAVNHQEVPSSLNERRKSSGTSELVNLINHGAHTQAGHTGTGSGPTGPINGSLTRLADLDVGTDVDGWSYGDNKWEGMGPKGGMGRVST